MVKKLLDLEQKSKMRDQIDTWNLNIIGLESELASAYYEETHILEAVRIKIRQNLKKIARLKENIRALQSQIRDGVEVQEPKTQLNTKKEVKNMGEDNEKSEDKSEDKGEEKKDE